MAGAPHIAGLCAVRICGDVAHLLEGVSAISEVAGALGCDLKFPCCDLGSVLCALHVLDLGQEAVDGAVEPVDLGVEHVDQTPHERLALVGHLCSVHGDAFDHDADGLAHGGERVVFVPDDAAVALALLGCCTEEGHALADCCGRGSGCACDVDHDDLPCPSSGALCPFVMSFLFTRAQGQHLALGTVGRGGAEVWRAGAEDGGLRAWEVRRAALETGRVSSRPSSELLAPGRGTGPASRGRCAPREALESSRKPSSRSPNFTARPYSSLGQAGRSEATGGPAGLRS